jgi:20S proteasome alpha/beta subunit
MTLIVAMKALDAIILAADSRGTIGDPRGLTAINDNQIKLFQLGCCGLGVAGASEMAATLLDEFRKNDCENLSSVQDAMQKVVAISVDCFSRWFREIPPGQRPGVLLTLAGYRFVEGRTPESMIYLLNSQANFAPQLFDNMPCMSGVPQYAVYLVHRYYDASMTSDQARALAEYLIAETESQDQKVGGPIKMAEITSKTGYMQLTDEEVKTIHETNEALNMKLRRFFLIGGD